MPGRNGPGARLIRVTPGLNLDQRVLMCDIGGSTITAEERRPAAMAQQPRARTAGLA